MPHNHAVQPTPPLRRGSLASLGAADRGRYAARQSALPVLRASAPSPRRIPYPDSPYFRTIASCL